MSIGKHTKNEINDQPEVWDNVLEKTDEIKEEIQEFFEVEDFDQIISFGSTSSHYSGMVSSMAFRYFSGFYSRSFPSSEILLYPNMTVGGVKGENKLFVPISRSGETSELLKALSNAQKNSKNSSSLGISCNPDSELMESVDFPLFFDSASEESVVQTKSFTSMLLGLIRIASSFSDKSYYEDLEVLPEICENVIGESYHICEEIFSENEIDHFVFLGSGPLYGIAQESSLKLKEMSIEYTEGFRPLDYRHGPKSIITENTLITLYLTENGFDYESDLIEELQDYGAKVLCVTNEREKINSDYKLFIESDLTEFALAPVFSIPAQVMGLEKALEKNIDPDKPRHLDSVVKFND